MGESARESGSSIRRSYMNDSLISRVKIDFAALGISDPPPCLFAWYAYHASGKTRHIGREEREQRALENDGETRTSCMDVLDSPAFANKVATLLSAQSELLGVSCESLMEIVPNLDSMMRSLPDHPIDIDCGQILEACIPWRCNSCLFGGPSYEAYSLTNSEPLSGIFDELHHNAESLQGVRAFQAPMAGRKTSSIARFAERQILDREKGRSFYLVVDTHATGDDFFDKLKNTEICPGMASLEGTCRIVVKLPKRNSKGSSNAETGESTPNCPQMELDKFAHLDCKKCNLSKKASNWRKENKEEIERLRLFDREYFGNVPDDVCRYNLNRSLARGADVLVLTQDHFLNPTLRGQVPELKKRGDCASLMIWDEADTLIDKLTEYAVREFQVVAMGNKEFIWPRVYKPGERCHKRCSGCYYAHPADPKMVSEDPLRPAREALRKGAEEYKALCRRLYYSEPVVIIKKVMENWRALEDLLSKEMEADEQDKSAMPRKLQRRMRLSGYKSEMGLYKLPFSRTTTEENRHRLSEAVLRMDMTGNADGMVIKSVIDVNEEEAKADVEFSGGKFLHNCIEVWIQQHIRGENVCSESSSPFIEQFLRFADITNADNAYLEITSPSRRSAETYTSCGIYLRRFDRDAVQDALDYIGSKTSVLVSGTFLDDELLRDQLGRSIDCKMLGSEELHDSVVFLIWNHRIGSAIIQDSYNLKHTEEITRNDLLWLLAEAHDHNVSEKMFVFTDSKTSMGSLVPNDRERKPESDGSRTGGVHGKLDIREFDGNAGNDGDDDIDRERREAGKTLVEVSYLRSSYNRGYELPDYRLCVLFGNGFQNGRDIRLDVVSREYTGDGGPEVEELWRKNLYDRISRYSRCRVIAQAATRTCRDSERRVVLLVGNFSHTDLPEYMRNRAVFVNELLEARDAPEYTNTYEKKKWQFSVAAAWMKEWVDGDQTIIREPYDWMKLEEGRMLTDRFHELLGRDACNPATCRKIVEAISKHGRARKSGFASRRGLPNWSELLEELCEMHILRDEQQGKRPFSAVPGPHYGILEEWSRNANTASWTAR
ncbi:MAG: hypothetical protein ACYC4F_09580 [Armatimonadota bacterium]